MILKEKERSVIEDLQTQEKAVWKVWKYAEQARDPELKIFPEYPAGRTEAL